MVTDTPSPVRVAAVQMVSGASVEDNLRDAATLIASAAAQGARLVALPEYFCLMGLRDTDKVAAAEQPGSGPIQSFLAGQARRHGIWLIGGTVPLASSDPARVFNASLVYDPRGDLVQRYDKIHLFAFQQGKEAYDEARTIAPGSEPRTVRISIGPLDLVVGLSICYDLRFPELFRRFGHVDLIVCPAAFTATTGKAHWEALLRARAIENLCYVLASAQGGTHENQRTTYGHSMFIDPWGTPIQSLAAGPGVVVGEIDPARIAACRASLPALRHRVLQAG